jgi:hypothetical protein
MNKYRHIGNCKKCRTAISSNHMHYKCEVCSAVYCLNCENKLIGLNCDAPCYGVLNKIPAELWGTNDEI